MPAWMYAFGTSSDSTVARPPLSAGGPEGRGIGLQVPGRRSDCSGARPSWYPFEVNVCDVDAPDPPAMTARERSISR
jgi:hypothetical protein